MDLQRVSEFITIVKEGSFKNAAEKLSISQSVLSERFRVFERSLNTTLIERGSHCLRLTASGSALFRHAEELLSSYQHITTVLSEMQEQKSGSLRLQFCEETLPARLEDRIAAFCKNHPRLFLNLYDGNYCSIQEGLLSNLTDIAFVSGMEDDYRNISGRIVLEHVPYMRVCLPKDHKLAERQQLSFSDLSKETFILPLKMPGNGLRELQLSALKKSGIEFSLYETDVASGLIDLLVSAGRGICFGGWTDRNSDQTVTVPLCDKGYDVFLYLLYRKETGNTMVNDFIKEIQR